MTPQELNKKLDQVVNDLNSNMGNIMAQIGSDALVSIRRRVIESGKDAEGNSYTPYSISPMLSGCKNMLKGSCEKIVGSKKKRKDLKWVTIESGGKNVHLFEIPGGYRQFREINGKQTGFVDFSFSGRMWANIKVVSNAAEHSMGVARIAAYTEEDKKKLEGNTSRRTDILKLSHSEIDELVKRFNVKIQQIVEKI